MTSLARPTSNVSLNASVAGSGRIPVARTNASATATRGLVML
jgi:hypothetical protein